MSNRLARETSPYLLQHQHNPVDWYPWGQEAFDAARAASKPIFLSVGYSTCYWCHVMERQCFENESIAKLMNEKFVNVKVDREERPDVDQLYMTAVQVLTRHGGWPMSVWLTPDLRPFYGGTYFPPTDAHGRPGFPTVINALSDAWTNRRGEIEKSADQIVSILRQLAGPNPADHPITFDMARIDELIDRSTSDYEPVHGGFGTAPKFPRQTLLELLLEQEAHHPNERCAKMIRHTLDAMANGGIRDHLGGGFHRYSTDGQWLVPHFEIMLYDNAMLGWCYVEAYRQFEEPRYARVARGILDFVLREMTSPLGAFYTAFDAEVDGQEGLNYLWTQEEVERVLAGKGGLPAFCHLYGLDRGPNFADPHHGSGRPDKNILFLPEGPEHEDDPEIVAMRQTLYEARRQRKQPLLDTKILTSWNALMIRALAYGGRVLQDQRYLDSAATAADFLLKHHLDRDGNLYRTSRPDTAPSPLAIAAKYNGFIDDYAFLAQALLELHVAAGDQKWKDAASSLVASMKLKFAGEREGGFFFTDQNASDLIVRQKVGSDSPLPSGNAVAAIALLELDHRDDARRTIEAFAGQIEQNAESMSALVQTAMQYVRRFGELKIEPQPGTADRADRPLSPQELASRVVSVGAAWADPQTLQVHVQVLQGFHIHAETAAKDFVATRLEARPARGSARIEYPPAKRQRFAFSEDELDVYEGRVTFVVRFDETQVGADPVTILLTYQACDDSACLPPVTQQGQVNTP